MRLGLHIAFGFVTLVVIGAAWTSTFGLTRVAPVPVVIAALYLGLTSRGHLASAVASAIFLGYLADVLSGTPIGLYAFCSAITAIAGHIAQGRFVLRGLWLGLGVAAFSGAAFLLLASALSRAVGIAGGSKLEWALLLACAALTAVFGSIQLALHRFIDARLARTQRERDARLEGVASA